MAALRLTISRRERNNTNKLIVPKQTHYRLVIFGSRLELARGKTHYRGPWD